MELKSLPNVSNIYMIKDIRSIAANFKRYFTEIGPTLAKKIDSSSVNVHKYLEAYNITQPERDLTVNGLKGAFFSLKLNKSPGYDEVSFNVIKKCFGSLHKPLLHIFNVSLQNGTFPDELKIPDELLPYLKMEAIQT